MAVRAPRVVGFVVRAPIRRGDLVGLDLRIDRLLRRCAPDVVHCDVAGATADAVTVDALARLRLAARRRGCRLVLCHASDELLELADFMGLGDALRVQPRG